MTTYTIYLGSAPIACVADTSDAYACYEAAKTIGLCTGKQVSLVWDETGEEVAYFDASEEDFDDEPADIDDDCGFDPYEGCFTFDC
jgi:hypothetical protein